MRKKFIIATDSKVPDVPQYLCDPRKHPKGRYWDTNIEHAFRYLNRRVAKERMKDFKHNNPRIFEVIE